MPGEICFILFFLLCGYFFWADRFWKGREREEVRERKESKCWYTIFIYGVGFLLVMGRKRFGIQIRGERLETMKRLYVGKGEKDIFFTHYIRTGCILSAAILFCLLSVSVSGLVVQKGQLLEGYFLKREDALGQEKTVVLSASLDGEEKEVTVEVPNIRYGNEELARKFQEAKEYVESSYLGENRSPEQVCKPLFLADSIPESSIVLEWRLGTDGVIQQDGSLSNEDLRESCQTEITAVFTYGDQEESLTKQLTVLPKQKTETELGWESWKRHLEGNQEESLTKEYLELPRQVEGKTVCYQEKKLPITNIVLGMSLFGIAAVWFLQEEKMRKELAAREKELRADYPEFVEYFVLLIGAGMNIKGAWERIIHDYQSTKQAEQRHYLYEEMIVSACEMENGMSEAQAYELFGKRTGLLQYMKFCTLIVQNLRKGSEDLLDILEYEVTDAFRERKESAKALGEEAGTKLLMPMMLMLVVVFAIILYAAFYNM